MNPKKNPCEDFEEFVCGKFLDEVEIPKDTSFWYASYSPLGKIIDNRAKILLEEEPTKESPFKTDKLARDQYKSCMNLSQIESVGLSPVKDILKKLHGWPVVEGKYFFFTS